MLQIYHTIGIQYLVAAMAMSVAFIAHVYLVYVTLCYYLAASWVYICLF